MRKIYLIVAVLFLACEEQNDLGSSEEEYVMAFKKTVLFGCINEASGGDFEKFCKDNNDLAITIESSVLYTSETLKAKKIGASLAKDIRVIDYPEFEGKKPIFSDCVDFAFSHEIDSISRARYKILVKSELEYINN